jgi:hypothetical protein
MNDNRILSNLINLLTIRINSYIITKNSDSVGNECKIY